jgi:hypothetical protein
LKHVPDPRKRQGRRHRFLTLLCLIVAALASAQRTPRAIARWVHEHREELFAVLPASVSRLPCEATLRRALALLDVTCLERALSAFAPACLPVEAAPSAAEPAAAEATEKEPRLMVKPFAVSDAMVIRVIWSLWCDLLTRGCSIKSLWPPSVTSAVRFPACWLAAI